MIIKEKTSAQKKKERTSFAIVITLLVTVCWLCHKPLAKVAQIGLWGNEASYQIAKMKHEDVNEYLFHRNNAIFLAKMHPEDKKSAIIEMDRAIETVPSSTDENNIDKLYLDRAHINYYLGNYEESLSDYMKAKDSITLLDYLPIGLMFANRGNFQHANYYCNKILNMDVNAFSGYACLSFMYEKADMPQAALKVWDYFIASGTNKAKAYVAKAYVKKRMGDNDGFEHEIANAKKINRAVDDSDYIEEALHPKMLNLNTTKIK